jgi:antitoxin HicB
MTTDDSAHIGSSFESWLDEKGLLEDATSFAIKEVIAFQISQEMKAKGISKSRMAELMQTSRSQVDRLLDPGNNSATLETLMRAARVLGRDLRLELV